MTLIEYFQAGWRRHRARTVAIALAALSVMVAVAMRPNYSVLVIGMAGLFIANTVLTWTCDDVTKLTGIWLCGGVCLIVALVLPCVDVGDVTGVRGFVVVSGILHYLQNYAVSEVASAGGIQQVRRFLGVSHEFSALLPFVALALRVWVVLRRGATQRPWITVVACLGALTACSATLWFGLSNVRIGYVVWCVGCMLLTAEATPKKWIGAASVGIGVYVMALAWMWDVA